MQITPLARDAVGFNKCVVPGHNNNSIKTPIIDVILFLLSRDVRLINSH